MNNVNTGPAARRPRGGRIAAIVASGVVALMSVGFLATGGLIIWADSKTDDQGYISTDNDRFSTHTRALVTENLDVNLDGAESLVDEGVFGKIRLEAESKDGKPVFVGIARTSDVTDYLRGSSHDLITDLDYSPFEVDYSTREGDRVPAAPGVQSIWDASATGAGAQALTWDVEDGDWSVVVMNADGSAGVHADVSAGANLGWLDEAGKVSLTTGFVLLIVAGGLLYIGVRRRPDAPLGTPDQATVTVA